ncbi:MAG TPA: GspH/FimT family pseudopilin [Burkholderiaceae bacterium]|nr:GspH/FimT family pseudopilin [Burkholderiaceae bacterium]
MNRPRGFTLLELLVVIVLAGILLSIVTISVTPDQRQQLAREAQRIGQLLRLAADEARIRQQPIVWEADLRGYRFVTESGGERQLLLGDDLLRERAWERELTRLALFEGGRSQPSQVLLGPGAPPLRLPIAREWVQPRFRLELTNDVAQVAIDFDESGRGTLAAQ